MFFSKRKPTAEAETTEAIPHLVPEEETVVPGQCQPTPAASPALGATTAKKPREPKKPLGIGLFVAAALVASGVAYLNHTVKDTLVPKNYLNLRKEDELKELMSLRFRLARASLLGQRERWTAQCALFDLAQFSLHKEDEAMAAKYLEQLLQGGNYFDPRLTDLAVGELCQIYLNQGKVADAANVLRDHLLYTATGYEAERAFYYDLAIPIFEKAGMNKEAELARLKATKARLLPDDLTFTSFSSTDVAKHKVEKVVKPLYLAARTAMAEGDYARARKIAGVLLDREIFPEHDYYVLRAQVMLLILAMVEQDYEAAKRDFPAAWKAVQVLRTMKNLSYHNDSYLFYKYYADFLERNGEPEKSAQQRTRAELLRQRDDERHFRDQWWKRKTKPPQQGG